MVHSILICVATKWKKVWVWAKKLNYKIRPKSKLPLHDFALLHFLMDNKRQSWAVATGLRLNLHLSIMAITRTGEHALHLRSRRWDWSLLCKSCLKEITRGMRQLYRFTISGVK